MQLCSYLGDRLPWHDAGRLPWHDAEVTRGSFKILHCELEIGLFIAACVQNTQK